MWVVLCSLPVGVAVVALAMGEWEGDGPKACSHSQVKVEEQRWRDEEQNLVKGLPLGSPWDRQMHQMKEA